METETTVSGRYLPRHVFAVRFDEETGAVQEAWSYLSKFQRLGSDYLPLSRQVIRAGQGDTSAMLIEWDDIELLDGYPAIDGPILTAALDGRDRTRRPFGPRGR